MLSLSDEEEEVRSDKLLCDGHERHRNVRM